MFSFSQKPVVLILSCSLNLYEQSSVVSIDFWYRKIGINRQPVKNKTWDYLVFTQSWPPGYCEFTQCSYPRLIEGFNIHGLWAETFPNTAIDQCDGPKYDNDSIKDIFEALKHEWVDEKFFNKPWTFWHHEWAKHGVCVTKNNGLIKNQHDYFAASLELKKHHNFTQIFNRLQIVPSNSTLYDRDSLLNMLKQHLGVDIWLQCSWKSGEDARLVEARVCLDRALKLFNCPPHQGEEMQLLSPRYPLSWTMPCPKAFVIAQ